MAIAGIAFLSYFHKEEVKHYLKQPSKVFVSYKIRTGAGYVHGMDIIEFKQKIKYSSALVYSVQDSIVKNMEASGKFEKVELPIINNLILLKDDYENRKQ